MNMTDVIKLVNTNRGTGKKESLSRMSLLMKKMGNPQESLKYVHIAGTNGKGSTSAFLASILNESDIKVGVYTSPHLERINERIQINGREITDEEFIRLTEAVAPLVEEVERELDEVLYSFEILTAVALAYFSEHNCELVILEAGIGGRLDATNIIETPLAAIITSIGLDHMKVLGESKEQIALEKAGIIKHNGVVIFPEMSPSIDDIVLKKARSEKAVPVQIRQSDILNVRLSEDDSVFDYKDLKNISIQLLGRHQISNAVLAIETAKILQGKGYTIEASAIKNGLMKAKWPGRMEKISEEPTVIIDGAHNPEGIEHLKNNLLRLFPDDKLIFVVGMMKDKAYMEMIRTVFPQAEKILAVSPDPYRGFDAEETAQKIVSEGIPAKAFESVESVVNNLKTSAQSDDKIVVFGSLYLIGEFRTIWK
ncbi:bifunctional folylpolyglutamate synthase/dihydrofolate synthase [Alkalibacterium sp.]|nr:MAG: bifunctional folylpolyglutamate synthase/dihydrofolate synthase [Alkalibacterium sp.]